MTQPDYTLDTVEQRISDIVAARNSDFRRSVGHAFTVDEDLTNWRSNGDFDTSRNGPLSELIRNLESAMRLNEGINEGISEENVLEPEFEFSARTLHWAANGFLEGTKVFDDSRLEFRLKGSRQLSDEVSVGAKSCA